MLRRRGRFEIEPHEVMRVPCRILDGHAVADELVRRPSAKLEEVFGEGGETGIGRAVKSIRSQAEVLDRRRAGQPVVPTVARENDTRSAGVVKLDDADGVFCEDARRRDGCSRERAMQVDDHDEAARGAVGEDVAELCARLISGGMRAAFVDGAEHNVKGAANVVAGFDENRHAAFLASHDQPRSGAGAEFANESHAALRLAERLIERAERVLAAAEEQLGVARGDGADGHRALASLNIDQAQCGGAVEAPAEPFRRSVDVESEFRAVLSLRKTSRAFEDDKACVKLFATV